MSFNTGFEGMQRKYDTSIFNTHHLSNGMPVLVQDVPIHTDQEGILMVVLPHVGSSRDPKPMRGLAHGLEHLVMKSNFYYPAKQNLTAALDEINADINASVSREDTTFYIYAPQRFLREAAEILRKVVSYPNITEAKLETEKGVLLSELRMTLSNEKAMLYEAVSSELLGTSQYVHRPVGKVEGIKSITADAANDLHQQMYHGGNFNLIVGGAFVEHPDCLAILEEQFSNVRQGKAVQPIDDVFDHYPTPSHELFIVPESGVRRDYYVLVWIFPRPTYAECEMFSSIARWLSSGFDSPIVKILREEKGWVYEHNACSFMNCHSFAMFDLTCAIEKQHHRDLKPVFSKSLDSLTVPYARIRQERRQKARELSFSHPVPLCKDVVSEYVTWGRIRSFREDFAVVDSLGPNMLTKACDFLRNTPCHEISLPAQ